MSSWLSSASACRSVVAGSTVLGVGTATDPHHVVAFAAVLDVFAVAALDGVVPAISVDDVVAGVGRPAVIAQALP